MGDGRGVGEFSVKLLNLHVLERELKDGGMGGVDGEDVVMKDAENIVEDG